MRRVRRGKQKQKRKAAHGGRDVNTTAFESNRKSERKQGPAQ